MIQRPIADVKEHCRGSETVLAALTGQVPRVAAFGPLRTWNLYINDQLTHTHLASGVLPGLGKDQYIPDNFTTCI